MSGRVKRLHEYTVPIHSITPMPASAISQRFPVEAEEEVISTSP
jgi:hypothetical protein